ncbi:hypothetical protein CCP4SC76_1800010 [Gammaproteobacteria bacterium]
MKILVKNIPADTTERSLIEFVLTPFSKKNLFSFRTRPDSAEVMSCEILRVTDVDSNKVEYHGVLCVRPDDAAIQLIRKLNGQLLWNQRVQVRRFHDRSPSDKRWREMTPREFRNLENRRRPRVMVEKVDQVSTKGFKHLARSHG